jgi:hypothetical protein
VATSLEIQDALAAQLATELATIDGIQTRGRVVWNPTPPCVDIYPAEPYQEPFGMGVGNNTTYLTVRARVNTPDHEGAQDLLLQMMDMTGAYSVEQAIEADKTLGGVVGQVLVLSGPSEFGAFVDPGGSALLGCTWRVQVIPA